MYGLCITVNSLCVCVCVSVRFINVYNALIIHSWLSTVRSVRAIRVKLLREVNRLYLSVCVWLFGDSVLNSSTVYTKTCTRKHTHLGKSWIEVFSVILSGPDI